MDSNILAQTLRSRKNCSIGNITNLSQITRAKLCNYLLITRLKRVIWNGTARKCEVSKRQLTALIRLMTITLLNKN